jgi:hypothetical protein
MNARRIVIVWWCILSLSASGQTYFLRSEETADSGFGPPWPINPCSDCSLYSLGDDRYVVDDGGIAMARQMLSEMDSEEGPPAPGGEEGESDTNAVENAFTYSFDTNQLWIELERCGCG